MAETAPCEQRIRVLESDTRRHGWGLWITLEKDKFWIALSYVGDGPTEAPAQWVISVTRPTSLNIVRRLFSKPDLTTMEALQARIRRELETTAGISVL